MEDIILIHDDQWARRISIDFHGRHFTSYFSRDADDGSADALLYLKCTRIRRRHLIDDETYWSAGYAIEIPLDGFEKQGEREIVIDR